MPNYMSYKKDGSLAYAGPDIQAAGRATEMTEAEIRADERRKIADMINDFSWVIPFYDDARINEASDDAACSVQDQIVRAVVAIS